MSARLFTLLLTTGLILASSSWSAACPVQAREHLTTQEIDLVKEAQILDKRIDVFIKAADRRLLALNVGEAPNPKQLKKDSEFWGGLPKGTRAELISDIAGILDEAITNIDDVSSRDEKNPLIPKALRKLAVAATHVVEQLKPFQAKAKDDAESASFELLVNNADAIVQAANKLPAPTVEKKAKSKTEKPKDTN
jgi:hypothetical protein